MIMNEQNNSYNIKETTKSDQNDILKSVKSTKSTFKNTITSESKNNTNKSQKTVGNKSSQANNIINDISENIKDWNQSIGKKIDSEFVLKELFQHRDKLNVQQEEIQNRKMDIEKELKLIEEETQAKIVHMRNEDVNSRMRLESASHTNAVRDLELKIHTLKEGKEKLESIQKRIERKAEVESKIDFTTFYKEIKPLNSQKIKIENELEKNKDNSKLLEESATKLVNKIDELQGKLSELNERETAIVLQREEYEQICENFRFRQAEELGHFIEEKQLINSLYELDEQKTKFSKLIDIQISEISSIQTKISTIGSEVNSKKKLIMDTNNKINNMRDSFLAADHIEKELNERIIYPYYNQVKSDHDKIELDDVTEEILKREIDVNIETLINLEHFNVLREEEFKIIENLEGQLQENASNSKDQGKDKLSNINFIKEKIASSTHDASLEQETQHNRPAEVIAEIQFKMEEARNNGRDVNTSIKEEHKQRLYKAAGKVGMDQSNLIKSANVQYEEIFSRESLFKEMDTYKTTLTDEISKLTGEIKKQESDLDQERSQLNEYQDSFQKIESKAEGYKEIISRKLDELSLDVMALRDSAVNNYVNSISTNMKKEERIQGNKTALKKASDLKENFKTNFMNTWKKNKEEIESVYNKIDRVDKECENIMKERERINEQVKSLKDQIGVILNEINEIDVKNKQLQDFLAKTNLITGKLNHEKVQVIKERIIAILKEKNYTRIAENIQEKEETIAFLQNKLDNFIKDYKNQTQQQFLDRNKIQDQIKSLQDSLAIKKKELLYKQKELDIEINKTEIILKQNLSKIKEFELDLHSHNTNIIDKQHRIDLNKQRLKDGVELKPSELSEFQRQLQETKHSIFKNESQKASFLSSISRNNQFLNKSKSESDNKQVKEYQSFVNENTYSPEKEKQFREKYLKENNSIYSTIKTWGNRTQILNDLSGRYQDLFNAILPLLRGVEIYKKVIKQAAPSKNIMDAIQTPDRYGYEPRLLKISDNLEKLEVRLIGKSQCEQQYQIKDIERLSMPKNTAEILTVQKIFSHVKSKFQEFSYPISEIYKKTVELVKDEFFKKHGNSEKVDTDYVEEVVKIENQPVKIHQNKSNALDIMVIGGNQVFNSFKSNFNKILANKNDCKEVCKFLDVKIN